MIYSVIVLKESDGRFSAIIPSLNHTASFGDTIQEALEMVREAAELYIETVYADCDLPEDQSIVNIDMTDYDQAYVHKIEIGKSTAIA